MKSLAILFFLLYSSVGFAASPLPNGCRIGKDQITASPPNIIVEVKNNRYNITQATSNQMSDMYGKSVSHNKTVRGLHSSSDNINISYSANYNLLSSRLGEKYSVCMVVEKMNVVIDFVSPNNIYIDSSLPIGGCRYNSVINHEKIHANNFYNYVNGLSSSIKGMNNIPYVYVFTANSEIEYKNSIKYYKDKYFQDVATQVAAWEKTLKAQCASADLMLDSPPNSDYEDMVFKNCKN